MKHLGLFEGIGGFSLGARWMGWNTIAWCEWDPFCQKVLKYHFPNANAHGDIKTTDFTRYAGQVDILTGGFPCQPYSSAGKRLGKEDDRHLWPEMLRAIREIKPRWIVGENVRGLTNWNGGLVFDEVQTDLENEGYQVTSYLLPACAVNAPHRRDRIWIIAYRNQTAVKAEFGQQWTQHEQGGEKIRQINTPSSNDASNSEEKGSPLLRIRNEETYPVNGVLSSNGHASNASSERLERPTGSELQRGGKRPAWLDNERTITNTGEARPQGGQLNGTSNEGHGQKQPPRPVAQLCEVGDWQQFPTQSPVCSRNDGISYRLDGIAFPKWREKSIGAYGNAIVPQVAYQIFKAISDFEQTNK